MNERYSITHGVFEKTYLTWKLFMDSEKKQRHKKAHRKSTPVLK